MSKLIVFLLTLAAFLTALYLVMTRRALPRPQGQTGLRRQFCLAVLVFATCLSAWGCGQEPQPEKGADSAEHPGTIEGGGEKPAPAEEPQTPRPQEPTSTFLDAVRKAWSAFDRNNEGAFNEAVSPGIKKGFLRRGAASLLAKVYHGLSYHHYRTTEMRVKCYRMTLLGGELKRSRQAALDQWRLIEKARESGSIDPAVAEKARDTLAREFEFMRLAEFAGKKGGQGLVDQYEAGEITPSEDAVEAAELIVKLGG